MEEKLIAPCGMNCALCVSYQAGEYDLKKKGLSRRYCAGCRPRGKHCTFMSSHCDLVGKGLVHFCFECSDFPCRRLKDLDKRYRTKYQMSMIENLKSIQADGISKFLEKQEAIWRCPECGEPICCHTGLCLNCSLETLVKKRNYRRDDKSSPSA